MVKWLKADVSIGGTAHRAMARYDEPAAPPAAVEWPDPVEFNAAVTVNGGTLYAVDCRAQAQRYEVTLAAAPILPAEEQPAAPAPQPEAVPAEPAPAPAPTEPAPQASTDQVTDHGTAN